MVDKIKLTFDTGVEVELSRPSQMLLSRVRREFLKRDPEPDVPQVWIEDANRNEDNPNDPDYIAAKIAWGERIGFISIDVVLATAVTILTTPEGLMDQNSEEFFAMLKMAGIPKPETDIEKKVEWIKTVAINSDEDLTLLQSKTYEIVGATEEQVAEATATFLGQAVEPTD